MDKHTPLNLDELVSLAEKSGQKVNWEKLARDLFVKLIDANARAEAAEKRLQDVRECVAETWAEHSDKNHPDYNGCDTEPCMWCVITKRALDLDAIVKE